MPDPLRRFAERTLSAWQELFQSSPREEERYLALQALVALCDRDQSVTWMNRGLQDPDSSLRAAAARWLANQAEGVTRPGTEGEWVAIRRCWQQLLSEADPDVRFESARGLLTLDANNEPATAVLLTLVNDAETQPAMLAAVLKTLSLGNDPTDSTAMEWPRLLHHQQAEVREQAARTLGQWGIRSTRWAHELLPLLDDEEPFVREDAANALGQIGIGSDPVFSALETASTDEDAVVAEAARAALQRLRQNASSR